jgi:hypothetical protein
MLSAHAGKDTARAIMARAKETITAFVQDFMVKG